MNCVMPSASTILCFPEDRSAAERLANALNAVISEIEHHIFPDGESLIRVAGSSSRAILYRSLHHPNGKILDVFLAASAARDQGAAKVILVSPYLPYMRQDVAFHAGEAVSQRVVGRMIASQFDGVVAVDPHLHRTHDIGDVFPNTPAFAVAAAPAVGAMVAESSDSSNTVLIGPDEESAPLIRVAAKAAGCVWMVGRKVRHGDRAVDLELPESPSLAGKNAVIFDDVISSGTTICSCARAALRKGVSSVNVYATHVLSNGEDEAAMYAAGVDKIISCDGVPHPTNGIALAPLIAEAVLKCL